MNTTMHKTKRFIICNIIWAAAIAIFVALDRITKMIAVSGLKDNDSVVFIKGLLSFTYVENNGAAWGILSGKISIFVIITVIIIPLLIFMLERTQKAKALFEPAKIKYLSLFQFDLILIIAGAVGNFIDRIINGYVIDFFQFTFIDFPIFNVADCYITVGAVLYIIIYLFLLKDEDFSTILKLKKGEKNKKESSENDEISD